MLFQEPKAPVATSGFQFTSQPKYLPSTCQILQEDRGNPVMRDHTTHPDELDLTSQIQICAEQWAEK